MPIADVLADTFVGHQVNLLRFSVAERRIIFTMLSKLQVSLEKQLEKTIPEQGAATFSRQRLKALFALTDKLIEQRYRTIAEHHQSTILTLAEAESEKAVRLVNAQVGAALLSVGATDATLQAMLKDDLVDGRPAKDWWSQQADTLRRRFHQAMRQGVFAGDTLSQLKQRVRGTRARQYQDGLMALASRNAEALIRTSVQSVANAARYETLKANDDVLAGQEWLSTLDNRTTPICQALSGQAWDFDGNPIGKTTQPFPGPPPAHWGCRSTLSPVLKSWEQLQRDARRNRALGKKLDRVERQIGKGTQASMDGQISADLTYEQWLKRQSKDAQIEILGEGRWDLWTRGKVTLTGLVDRSLKPLTLDELKRA